LSLDPLLSRSENFKLTHHRNSTLRALALYFLVQRRRSAILEAANDAILLYESWLLRFMSFSAQTLRAFWKAAGMAVVFLSLVSSFAQRSEAQDRARYGSGSARMIPVAAGDFDGDNRPDLATVQMGQASPSHARYWILVQFSTGLKQSIGVTAPVGGLQIASRDVNGDSSLDLVVSTAWLNQPVAVLLNDGRGNFAVQDANAFPTSTWAPETSVASPNVHIKDALVVLPRPLTGDRGQNEASLPLRVVTDRRVFEERHEQPFSVAISVLGRAPPAASLRA
jgi:hypothetical protein